VLQGIDAATDHVVRARLLAACSPGSGDLLEALLLSSVELKMDNETIRIAAGFRLGAAIVRPHMCICGATVTVDGHHGISGRHCRHNQLNDLLCCAFTNTGTLATREPHSLCTSGGKRSDGVTQVPLKRGRCLAWDATCSNTIAQSYIQDNSTLARSAASAAELNKIAKYSNIIAGVDFVPFVIETSGVSGQ